MNRFFYFCEPTGTSEEIALAFASKVVPDILGIMNDQGFLLEIEATCLSSSVIPDYVIGITTGTGELTGEVMPTYVASSYKLKETSTLFKHAGGKRFPAVPEGHIANGKPDIVFTIASDLLETTLSNLLLVGAQTYFPVLARFDDDVALWAVASVVEAVLLGIYTQNSRKDYKGGGPLNLLPEDINFTWDTNQSQWGIDPSPTSTIQTFTNFIGGGGQKIEGTLPNEPQPITEYTN